MNIGVFGTGGVGLAIGKKLAELGHAVKAGSRTPGGEKAKAWVSAVGQRASEGSYADAAQFGEILFNCTQGTGSLEALELAGTANLGSKILVDIANPLDFSQGFPPALSVSGHDSLAEQIQRAYPNVKVVKTLNTINSEVMIDPGRLKGPHTLFISGNDDGAKARVRELLATFGWREVVDLGDITGARGMEAYVLFWLRIYSTLKTPDFNIQLVR